MLYIHSIQIHFHSHVAGTPFPSIQQTPYRPMTDLWSAVKQPSSPAVTLLVIATPITTPSHIDTNHVMIRRHITQMLHRNVVVLNVKPTRMCVCICVWCRSANHPQSAQNMSAIQSANEANDPINCLSFRPHVADQIKI